MQIKQKNCKIGLHKTIYNMFNTEKPFCNTKQSLLLLSSKYLPRTSHKIFETKAVITKLFVSRQPPAPILKINNGKYLRVGRRDFDSVAHSHLM